MLKINGNLRIILLVITSMMQKIGGGGKRIEPKYHFSSATLLSYISNNYYDHQIRNLILLKPPYATRSCYLSSPTHIYLPYVLILNEMQVKNTAFNILTSCTSVVGKWENKAAFYCFPFCSKENGHTQ
jgi:hypothetical protein